MSSVISARRRCEGRTEVSEVSSTAGGEVRGDEGLASARTAEGDMGESTSRAAGVDRSCLTVKAVACDMSRTSMGRTYLPSDWV